MYLIEMSYLADDVKPPPPPPLLAWTQATKIFKIYLLLWPWRIKVVEKRNF